MRLTRWQLTNILALIVMLLLGSFYISKTWSPSSYGIVLVDILGKKNLGPSWGVSRPIRSDEWQVVTPLTQATVNNHFERFNKTSLYGEDLRINYGLPIADWGRVFKPSMWFYGLVNPAYAYSFHWFFLFALFIIGYAWIFHALGASPVLAYLLSTGLYYSGTVQFWWNEKGPVFAIFPWVLIPLLSRLPLHWKAIFFYWIATSWLITNFYPPYQISLAFVGFLILLSAAPNLFKFKSLLTLGLASILAAVTSAYYLYDYLLQTSRTVYPGGRSVTGGGYQANLWPSWLIPNASFNSNFDSLVGQNICEIGAIGLLYSLMIICFADFSKLGTLFSRAKQSRQILILGFGLLTMFAWICLPIPAWIGMPLLWNNIYASRMVFACGILLVFFLFSLGNLLGFRLTLPRLLAFMAIILVDWVYKKTVLGEAQPYAKDFIVFVFLIPGYCIAKFYKKDINTTFAFISLASGIFIFWSFNPLQPAWPIFNRHETKLSQAYDQLASQNNGVLSVVGLPGAVANGLGYRSLSHLTAIPQLEFWRKQYPDMDQAQFNNLFNRYSHIDTSYENLPKLIAADAIQVPVSLFLKAPKIEVKYITRVPKFTKKSGALEGADIRADVLYLRGWANWRKQEGIRGLEVFVEPSVMNSIPLVAVVPRLDLAGEGNEVSAVFSGFEIQIPYADLKMQSICIFSVDQISRERVLLNNPAGIKYCNAH
jgi:hypothetical protein